jgi:hypothetical protein
VRADRRALVACAIALAALLAGCMPKPRPAMPDAPPEFPRAYYEEAASKGLSVHRIDPQQSLVVIEVRRGGSLARLGHDHIVSARNVQGYVAPDAGRADLYIALEELVVDEPALRKAAGFDTQPTAADIASTRANMLEKVLEADKFPRALIGIERKGADRVTATVTLHGVTRALDVPARIAADKDRTSVSGTLELNQTDFGITPFSILGGAIQVQDRLVLAFTIHAAGKPE